MRALWTAPYRADWLAWTWPMDTTFHGVWVEEDLRNVPQDISVLYANPNAGYVLSADIKERLPGLKAVVTPSTGETHLDRGSLEASGVSVYSLLDDREALGEIRASSEFTFLLVLNALRRLDDALLNGRWKRDEELLRGRELYGQMVGLVGHGRIGKNLETWLRAFGAGVYWNDGPRQQTVYCPSVEWMFRSCGIVVVCCALNEDTRGMVRGDWVRQMQPGAILINTARGEVMREAEVAQALKDRPDIQYWTDVLSGEAGEGIEKSPLLGKPNVFVTPHIAGTTVESQEKAARIAMRLTERWLSAKGKRPAQDVRVHQSQPAELQRG